MPDGKFISLDQRLYDYVVAHGNNSDPLLKELATETATRLGRISGMQIAPEQGTFMGILPLATDFSLNGPSTLHAAASYTSMSGSR